MAKPPSNKRPYKGFGVPRSNYFKMPQEWTDLTAEIGSLAELKVIEYVLRHTWGFQEFGIAKKITTDEFMYGRKKKDGIRMDKGTGLSKPSVIEGLKLAVRDGFLVEDIDDTDRARIKKYYALKMDETVEDEERTPAGDPNADVKNLDIGVKNLYSSGKDSSHRSEKDTLERNLQQQQQGAAPSEQGSSDVDVVALLTSKKISRKVSQDLARKFPADYILEKIDILDVLIESHDPNAPTSPAGWLRKAIEDDYAPPDWYKTKAEREAAQIAQKRLQEQQAAEAEREREAERHKREQWRSMLIERHRVSQKHLTLWAQTVSQVQEITIQENLKRWLGKTLLISQKDGTATIAVPYEYASQQMADSALEHCQEILEQELGRSMDLRLEVVPYPDSG